ncbi:retinol dehydrogenase 12-like protein [Leptotrombidium deliense]|uniref:Retinol dehydrogenase 12-like protein n=1 Tax=Leptotrombidium deliense TaxID=299467 RepID=A0A443S699_9ACAR|nr:retinol dehydrogenase 12-like protein [Leptotrombidium deliense]
MISTLSTIRFSLRVKAFYSTEALDTRMTARMCNSNARLNGKTVIITGGNNGLGKETAIDLAKRAIKTISLSKLANIVFTKELSRRLNGTNVCTYCCHPGIIPTNLFPPLYKYGGFRSSFTRYFLIPVFGKTVKQGAQTQIYCAVDEAVANETGMYYVNCRRDEPKSIALNRDIGKKFWDVSMQMISLNDTN